MADERHGRLEAVTGHGQETRSLVFALDAPLRFAPGQFVSCLIPHDGARIVRPYTIASNPEESERIELLLDRVPGGPGSGWLFALPLGGQLAFTGPWGVFTLERAPDAEAVFVAIGTGIAPIRPMLHRASSSATRPLRLLYATTNPVYRDELAALPGVTLELIPPAGVVDAVRARWVDADADRSRRFFLCGVGGVVPRLRDLLRGAGYERRAVQYERW